MTGAFTVTRVANSCTVLDFDGEAVLTDPFFTERLASSARRIGFEHVECVEWGERRPITAALQLEVVEAHHSPGGAVNNYVLATGAVRVFFGGEARDLGPLREYRATRDPVDVALLPVNGLHIPVTGPRLVMGSDVALEGARVLGARVLVPIHDAHAHDLPWRFLRRDGSAARARECAKTGDPDVVCLETGVAWSG
jgi:L-ascorbate metabolism protein UlaG (beta-lactamase superfamily)